MLDGTPRTEKDTHEVGEDAATKPLYEDAPISVLTSVLLILAYSMHFKISGAALAHVIILIRLHCPVVNNCIWSLYMFKKFFQGLRPDLKFHYYCNYCLSPCSKESTECCNTFCRHGPGKEPLKKEYFLELPIVGQLQSILKRTEIHEQLMHRFERKKKHENNYEDIYDGEIYQKHFGPNGFLRNPYNISFMWNTDGVPIFKSSNFGMWPFYLVINELPHKKRISKENLILSGIWFGEHKPNMAYFLIPQLESIQFLKKTGINIEWSNKETVTVKGMLLCGTCDMPAKALVLNMMQYNGKYGCPVCLQEGKTVKTRARRHVHAFPFENKDPTGPLRSTSESKKHSSNAVQNENQSYGIKGPCALNIQDNMDSVGGTSVDYMHGVLLGVTKLLMNLWFGKDHSSEDFSVHTRVAEIEEHLLKMKPPNRITRVPRSFTQHLNYWKASEFRSWLLFYSLPALYDILPTIYYEHFALLSSAIFIFKNQFQTRTLQLPTNFF